MPSVKAREDISLTTGQVFRQQQSCKSGNIGLKQEEKGRIWTQIYDLLEYVGHDSFDSLNPTEADVQPPENTIRSSVDRLISEYVSRDRFKPDFEKQLKAHIEARASLEAILQQRKTYEAGAMAQIISKADSISHSIQSVQESIQSSMKTRGVCTHDDSSRVQGQKQDMSTQAPETLIAIKSDQQTFAPRRFVHSLSLMHFDERPPGSVWKPIKPTDYDLVVRTLTGHTCNVRTASGQTLTYEDFASLSACHCVNDQIIQQYLDMITRASTNGQQNRVASLDSLFASTLMQDRPYQVLKNLTNRVRLASLDLLFIPVNILGQHWALITLDFKKRLVWILDSLETCHPVDLVKVSEKTLKFLQHWTRLEQGVALETDWSHVTEKSDQQQNNYDCGVFLMAHARILATADMSVSVVDHKSINHFRRKILLELISGQLMEL